MNVLRIDFLEILNDFVTISVKVIFNRSESSKEATYFHVKRFSFL